MAATSVTPIVVAMSDTSPSLPLRRASSAFVAALLTTVVLALLASGCGGDGGDGAEGGGASATVPVGGEPPAEVDDVDRADAAVPDAVEGEVTRLDSAQGRALLDARPETLVIDVRDVDDYIDGHLVGAQNISWEDQGLWERRVSALDLERPTAVYCGTGNLSAPAAADLVERGFTRVYDLGGVTDWDEGDLPLDR